MPSITAKYTVLDISFVSMFGAPSATPHAQPARALYLIVEASSALCQLISLPLIDKCLQAYRLYQVFFSSYVNHICK